MASSAGLDASSICDRVERLRDVSRLILDAIERDDLSAMERHVNESESLIAMIGAGLAERRTESAGDSRGILDHIRRMNASMVDRLRSRQTEVLDEIGRARAIWHRVRQHPQAGDGEAEGFDRQS